MHNWLIFQYHRVRAQPNAGSLGAAFGRTDRTLQRVAKGGRRRVGEPRRWLYLG